MGVYHAVYLAVEGVVLLAVVCLVGGMGVWWGGGLGRDIVVDFWTRYVYRFFFFI